MYIRNSKSTNPVKGMKSIVVSPSGQTIGVLLYRSTKTGRRNHSGSNHWDLFCFISSEGYRQDDSAHGIVLGRVDGEDIVLSVQKLRLASVKLANGFQTDEVWEIVEGIKLVPSKPKSAQEVEQIFAKLPFHQPGGEGSYLEEISSAEAEEIFQRESESYEKLRSLGFLVDEEVKEVLSREICTGRSRTRNRSSE